MGLDNEFTTILGISVPAAVIPVKPGRNLAIIIEVAAMNNRQKRWATMRRGSCCAIWGWMTAANRTLPTLGFGSAFKLAFRAVSEWNPQSAFCRGVRMQRLSLDCPARQFMIDRFWNTEDWEHVQSRR